MNYPIGLFATHLELQFRNIALLIEGLQNILEHCMRSARCVLGSWQTSEIPATTLKGRFVQLGYIVGDSCSSTIFIA